MSLFSRILGKKEVPAASPDHAVIVHIPLSDGANGTSEEFAHLTALEEKIG